MSRLSPRRAAPLAAVALAAAGGAAFVTAAGPAAAVGTPATPGSDSPSTGYALSISVAQSSITPGQSDTVSGTLTEAGVPQPGDTVYLRARPADRRHARRVQSGTTGADGSVSFTVTPSRTTHYRLVFRGSATTPTPSTAPSPSTSASPSPAPSTPPARAHSKVATIHVVRASSLSIREQTRRSGRVVISGQLRGGGHPLRYRKVTLEEAAVGSSDWAAVKSDRTGRDGMVRFRLPAPTSSEQFELVFAGDSRYHGCQSGIVTDTVS